jgi:hypothetical protein
LTYLARGWETGTGPGKERERMAVVETGMETLREKD